MYIDAVFLIPYYTFMKRLVSAFILVLLSATFASAQIFQLNNGFTNGQTVSTCTGTFVDANSTANYFNNENYTVTFCPADPTKKTQVGFEEFALATGDTLYVYDGASTAATLLDKLYGVEGKDRVFTGSTVSGCLTFQFISDAAGTAEGWLANIYCKLQCQAINVSLVTSPPADAAGNVFVCPETVLNLTANVTYPQNNTGYTQSNATSIFKWKMNGLGANEQGLNLSSITRNIPQQANGYKTYFTLIDDNGCASEPIALKIKTSQKPIFNIQSTSFCLGNRDTLYGRKTDELGNTTGYVPVGGSFVQPPISGDSIFLPDTPPLCFTSDINVSQFAPGQTLTTINDILGIDMNIEHSYLGDLRITITAPNGATVTLHNASGGNCFLGEPVDEDLVGGVNPALSRIIGNGYNYSFTNTATLTMQQSSTTSRYSYVDNAGQRVNNHLYLPEGDYRPSQVLNALAGTPLNGKWTLKICDGAGIDNGYLFNWGIRFNPTLYPDAEVYTIPITSAAWLAPRPGLLYTNGDTAIVSPSNAGTFPYTFRVNDAANCNFDTVINVVVNPNPLKPDLGTDKIICTNESTNLTVLNPEGGITYTWSNGASGTLISVNQPGEYIVTASAGTCIQKDTILVTLKPLPQKPVLGNDVSQCGTQPVTLAVTNIEAGASYTWKHGAAGSTTIVNASGEYIVFSSLSAGGCELSDTINVAMNPFPQKPDLGIDTVICYQQTINLNIKNPETGITYTWNNGSTGNPLPVSTAGEYIVTATTTFGCPAKDTINVVPQTALAIAIRDTAYCASSANNTFIPAVTGNIVTYLWNDNSTNPTLTFTAPGLYWVQGTSPSGCSVRDSATVIANPINAWQTPDNTSFCDRDSITITLNNAPAGSNFLWADGSTNPEHTFKSGGVYGATASYIGCLKYDDIALNVRPLPIINIGVDTTICDGLSIPLKVSYPGATYLWNTGKTDSAIIANNEGIYWAQATYDGCSYRDSLTVMFMDCSCYPSVPSAFSPNGDGVNDQFKINISCFPAQFKMSIFNRYGQQVFETTDVFKGWDGTYQGKILPLGTYYYIINYFNRGFRKTEQFTGNITLLK